MSESTITFTVSTHIFHEWKSRGVIDDVTKYAEPEQTLTELKSNKVMVTVETTQTVLNELISECEWWIEAAEDGWADKAQIRAMKNWVTKTKEKSAA